MGVFKNLARFALGRNLSKKNPDLTGFAYMALGSMHDEEKKKQKELKRAEAKQNGEMSETTAKVFGIILLILVVGSCVIALFSHEDKDTPKTEKKINTDTRKVYKTNSKEYFQMLHDTADTVANKYDDIYLYRTKTYATTYYHIIIYSNKYIKKDAYDKIKESYIKDLKEELSKYKYKTSFTNNYEIVQVYFYNTNDPDPYTRGRYTWEQFYTTDLD